jgi:phosphoenolpyruvate-protein phosphotransferase
VLLHGQVTDSAPVYSGGDVILLAENLTPSDIAQLDQKNVIAFCTVNGGATSHVAILARSLGIPAISGMDPKVLTLDDGSEVLLDGDKGEIHLTPSPTDKVRVRKVQLDQLEKRRIAQTQAHSSALTRDGKRIEVAANIGGVADAIKAVELGADGVGLLRSEFLFLERDVAPTEDEQYQIYQSIADVLEHRPLVIRTLDVGGDKPLKYLAIPHEENPFLGIRGIRVGLLHQQIFRDQVSAILRVKSRGKIQIMFPMIATLEELLQAKAILEEERQRLKVPAIEIGVMVEVPSAALIAESLAREVDFFSIGTNDLTQYTLAMDRGHKDLAKQADALHPSVLHLIGLTCEAARKHGKWVGVCGGLAGDLNAVAILLGLGVEELSVSIPSIPLVKSQVRETTMAQAQNLAERALLARTAGEVRELKQGNQDSFQAQEASNAIL